MSNASAPQDVVDAKASLDEHQNVSVSALAANTLVSNRSRSQRWAASRKARGFLSGVVRKKLKLQLISELGKDGVRRYRAASVTPAKA